MKKVLITGKNSYIGNSLEKWLMKEPENYQVDKISMRDESWKEKDFSSYDVVIHVAGIAHVSSDSKIEELYYRVNRDLTIAVAKKSKFEGVKQFIFMSSIIVYGDSTSSKKVIDIDTLPNPSNFYGNSKLKAEEGIRHLDSTDFKIAIIRPPMIYGKGSKGNFIKLSKLARFTPLFPDFDNERSILHIDNLTEFLKLVIDDNRNGLFFPQNKEYVKTSTLVKAIAEVYGKKIWITNLFNPLIKKLFVIGLVKKTFGNLIYEKSMSDYSGNDYRVRDLDKSIEMTEGSE